MKQSIKNTITISIDNTADINAVYNQLKKQYPKFEIIKNQEFDRSEDIFFNTHTPDGKPKRKFATKEEFRKFLEDTAGSIDDPTFVEPPEIEYESFREPII